MTFTKRERVILLVMVAVLAALALDRFALTPLLDRRQAAQAERDRLVAEMARAESLLSRRKVIGPRWRRMTAEGLKPDPAEAESQVLRAIGVWADEARLNLVSLRPERSEEASLLPEIEFRATGTGSMAAVSRFLWRLETASIPLHIKNLELASRREGTDNLSVQLKMSTLYRPPPSEAAGERDAGAPAEGEDP